MKFNYLSYGILAMLCVASSCKRQDLLPDESLTTASKERLQNVDKLVIASSNGSFKYNASTSKLDATAAQISGAQTPAASFIDKVAYSSGQISEKLEVSHEYDFYLGLQSPYDANQWVYLEREQIGAGYHLYAYNAATDSKTLLISEKNADRSKLAFKPIGWTGDTKKLYLEGLYLDTSTEHEGIWVFDLSSKSSTRVEVPVKMMRTPILTPNRDKFLILGTNDAKYEPLHGATDVLVEFDIAKKSKNVLLSTKGAHILIQGWERQGDEVKKLNAPASTSLVDYYLPWDTNRDYCVSRHGTPAPSGTHTYVGMCNLYTPGGQHGYPAVDFDTPNNAGNPVWASQAGTVTVAGWQSSDHSVGYGLYVVIRHSDGQYTYYGHNSSLNVSAGQTVTQGQKVATEGTTGSSTGDHIHFEWRNSGGSTSIMGTFKDRGQPRQNYTYRSNNFQGTPPPCSSIGTFEDFASGVGRFTRQPTYSGTTVGVATTSTASHYVSGSSTHLKVTLNDNTSLTTNWFVRLLSGDGIAGNNVCTPKTGNLYFWLKTSNAGSGATGRIWVDDSDGTEQSSAITIINDGAWHKYNWPLSSGTWTAAAGGNGAITAASVTLDAIILARPNNAAQWVAYIDDVGN